MTEAVQEWVAAADQPAPAAVQDAGIEGLIEIDGVDENVAQRLIAWAKISTEDTRQFETRTDVTERRALAIEGFQHCQ